MSVDRSISLAFSTASLFATRSLGVVVRYFALLSLGSVTSADVFAPIALAFVVAELARAISDSGLDTVFLRKAEGLESSKLDSLFSHAWNVKIAHGLLVACAVGLTSALFWRPGLLPTLIALQFLSQTVLQLALNYWQAKDGAHRVVGGLATIYIAALVVSLFGYLGSAMAIWVLPGIAAAEFLFALYISRRAVRLRISHIISGYREFFPAALPMLGVAILAFANGRADSVLVASLLKASEAGQYMYLMRWTDIGTMIAIGTLSPLVGKVDYIRSKIPPYFIAGLFVCLLILPFVMITIATNINSAYQLPGVQWMIAGIGSVRVSLQIATILLLSKWKDGWLFRISLATSITITLGGWLACSIAGTVGLALVVLLVEFCNLAVQVALLAKHRKLEVIGPQLNTARRERVR